MGIDGGATLLRTTFSNTEEDNHRQAYPGAAPAGDYPACAGAAEIDTLGYTYYGDSVYHLTFDFSHDGGTLVLNFSASGLQGISDESWGLDNVRLSRPGAGTEANEAPVVDSLGN